MSRDDYDNVDVGKYRGINDTEQRHDAAEVAQEDVDAANDFWADVEHQMDNYLPAKGETSYACEKRRSKTDLPLAFARHRQASEARLIAKLQSEEARERVADAVSRAGIAVGVRPLPKTATRMATAALTSVVELLGKDDDRRFFILPASSVLAGMGGTLYGERMQRAESAIALSPKIRQLIWRLYTLQTR